MVDILTGESVLGLRRTSTLGGGQKKESPTGQTCVLYGDDYYNYEG